MSCDLHNIDGYVVLSGRSMLKRVSVCVFVVQMIDRDHSLVCDDATVRFSLEA